MVTQLPMSLGEYGKGKNKLIVCGDVGGEG